MTHILTHRGDTFEFPALGAVRTKRGHVNEMITLMSNPVDSQFDDDVRPLQVSTTRTADNDPSYADALLDHRVEILIGEETDHGYTEVVTFNLEQAERFAHLLNTAIASAKADLAANAEFVNGTEAVA